MTCSGYTNSCVPVVAAYTGNVLAIGHKLNYNLANLRHFNCFSCWCALPGIYVCVDTFSLMLVLIF